MRGAFASLLLVLLLLAGCGSSNGAQSGAAPSVSHPGLFAVYYTTVDPRNPQTVYVASNDALLKTTDGGGSWMHLEPSAYGVSGGIVLDPRRPDTVFVGAGDGVYKSTDGGRSWRRAGLKGQTLDDLEFARSGSVLYASVDSCLPSYNPECIYYSGPAVFKTTDAGARWVPIGLAAQPGVSLALDPRRPAVVYATTEKERTSFKSTDGGASWHRLHGFLAGAGLVVIDPHSPQKFYATTADGGLFESTDGGRRWLSLGLTDVRDFAVGPAAVYAATGRGVLMRPDGGRAWRILGARGKALYTVAVSGNGRVLYAGADGNTVYRFQLAG